jgi:hypothetical protein
MSNRNKIYSKGRISGQWTALRWEVMDSAAWRQMSMGARMLYIALIRPLSFNADNNGKIFLSTRRASEQLGASQRAVWIWFHELEHYGFIVMTEPGSIGPKGKAAHWRITDVGWGRLDGKSIEPTKDYLKWTGELFDHPTSKNRKTANQSRQGDVPKSSSDSEPKSSLGSPGDEPKSSYARHSDREPKSSYLVQPSPPSGKGNGEGKEDTGKQRGGEAARVRVKSRPANWKPE